MMIIKFKSFVNESLKDKLKGKSEEEIIENITQNGVDIDYVFELTDGKIINIQFDENGNKVTKTYDDGDEFTEFKEMKDIDPDAYYVNFYNSMSIDSHYFNFIGMADGHDESLFN
jgi:hypothetical protein